MTAPENPDDRQTRLEQVLADYLQSVEAGTPPNRSDLLAAHSDLADELQSFFRNQDAMAAWGRPLRETSPAEEPTFTGEAPVSHGSLIRRIRYLGDYELMEEIARGGMGVVFRARQVSLNRIVAVKMILVGQLATEIDVHRFRREAEAAAGLDHPRIVPIYEVGSHDGQHYFSMKLIDGGSLRDELTRLGGRLPTRRAVEMTSAIARGLQHAHERGVLHRDMKPGNILLDAAGAPLLTDFGLAKRVQGPGASDLTASGAVLGTPSYMAPEQAAGRGLVTTSADVYGLGAVLYETLAGRPPFQEATPVQTVVAVMEREPTAPTRFRPELDRDLETITLKCLQKDPERRYRSAGDLADDLDRWLRGEPITARPVGRWESARRWCGRNRALSAAIVLGVLTCMSALALAIGGMFTLQLQKEQARTQAALQDVERERGRAARIEIETARERGQSLCEQGRISEGLLWLARALDLCGSEEPEAEGLIRARIDAWRSMLHPLEWRERHPGSAWFLMCSGDGTRLLVSGGNASQLRDAATGQPVGPIWEESLPIMVLRFVDPQPEQVVEKRSNTAVHAMTLSLDGTLRRVDASTGQQLSRLTLPGGPFSAVDVSADGSRAATAREGAIAVWNAKTGAREAEFTSKGASHAVQFAPSGQLLASADPDGSARVWNLATGMLQGDPLPHPGLKTVDFSPNGEILATGRSPDFALRLWSLKGGAALGSPLMHRDVVYSTAFSPDGALLATSSTDQTGQLWKVPATSPHRAPLRHEQRVICTVFSPDGRYVVTGSSDRTARVWETNPTVPLGGPPRGAPLLHDAFVMSAAFSPEGKHIYTASLDGVISRWKLAGRPESRLYPFPGVMTSLAVSPAGDYAAAGMREGTLHLLSLGDQAKERAAIRIPAQINGIVFSPDGRNVVTGDTGGGVQIWSTDSGKPAQPRWTISATEPGQTMLSAVTTVDFGVREAMVIAAAGKRVVRWRASDGRRLEPDLVHPDPVHFARFTPGGSRILTISESLCGQLWDAVTGLPVGKPLSTGRGNNAVFRPDGTQVLLGSSERRALLFDLESRQPVSAVMSHDNSIGPLAISADGMRIFTASDDTTIRAWTGEGKLRSQPLVQKGIVGAIGLSPDARFLVSVTDSEAQLWDADAARPLGLPFPARRGEWWQGAVWLKDSGHYLTAWPDEGVRLTKGPSSVQGTADEIRRQLESDAGASLDDQGGFQLSRPPAP